MRCGRGNEGCFCAYGEMGKVMGGDTATGTGKRASGSGGGRREGGREGATMLCGAEQGGEFTCLVWESGTGRED